jgi:hypothetical protein
MAEAVKKLLRERPALSKRLFIIYGSNEGPSVSARVPELAALIEGGSSKNFILGVRSVPDGGHIPKSSLEDGLRFVFSAH